MNESNENAIRGSLGSGESDGSDRDDDQDDDNEMLVAETRE